MLKLYHRQIKKTTLFFCILFLPLPLFAQEPTSARRALFKTVFSEAANFREKTQGLRYSIAEDKKGRPLGLIFFSDEVSPENYRGYQAPLRLLVGMDLEGRVTFVNLLAHQEDPGFMDKVIAENFVAQYKGKLITGLTYGKDIDAVSGATLTATSLHRALQECARLVLADFHSTLSKTAKGDSAYLSVQLIIVFALLVFALLGFFKRSQFLRNFSLFFSFLYLGMTLKGGLSITQIANFFKAEFFHSYLWLLWLSALAMVFCFGRFYCGWLCPFGALSEFLNHLGIRKLRLSNKLNFLLRNCKYLILIFFLIALFAGKHKLIFDLEPFAIFFTLKGRVWGWLVLAVALIGALFIPRFYCRVICPLGAFFATFANLSLRKLKVKAGCALCAKCLKICPTQALVLDKKKVTLNHRECIRCERCVEICSTHSLGARHRFPGPYK
jgi:Na+-translocating ferredoxin:NAD+ oxidoreductase RnfG subunit/ferredoxin